MNLIEAIYARRSVRAYAPTPIAREALDTMIAAAVQAPTGMNSQPWAFGVVQSVEHVKAWSDRTKAFMLANLDNFPALERYRAGFADPESNICYGAPAMVVIYGKPNAVTMREDCTMAAYALMLAATDMGLGSCWMGFTSFVLNTSEAKAELGVPADYTAIAPIILGHPADNAQKPDRTAPDMLFWQE
jgi:nitroreductase